MAGLTSPITTYSDTTPQKRVITDVISLIDPVQVPMLEKLGGLDGAASKFRFVNQPGTVIEWLEDSHFPLTDALNGSIASNTTAVTVDEAGKFKEGDIIDLGGGDQGWVSAVTVATQVLTVTRNYNSAQASHADNVVIEIVGQARLEGDDSDDRSFTDRTVNSNFTQIFHEEVSVTRTQRKRSQYGITDEMEYQRNKTIPALTRLIEQQAQRGVKKAGTASTPRAFGGWGDFITDNTINAAGAVTQADFEDLGELMNADGGFGPWLAFVTPGNLQVIKNFYDGTTVLRVDRTETTVGMKVTRIETPFGDFDLVNDHWTPAAKIPCLDTEHAGFLTYDPFGWEAMGKTGDSEKEEVVGEFTFCLRQDKAHGVITGIS
jgi:hypothetical protein